MTLPQPQKRRYLPIWGIATALLGLLTWYALRTFSPSPPRTLTMSTGAPDGAYHQFGLKYQAILKQSGVNLVLKNSAGSLENLQRLEEGNADVALVQGGLGALALDPLKDESDTRFRTLVTVTYEPVWIFTRQLDLSSGLAALQGKRVAIGPANSGSSKVAIDLLREFGVLNAQGQPQAGMQIVPEGGMAAAKRLQEGTLDALILVAAPESPVVNHLLNDTSVALTSLRQAEGLARRLPYFQSVSLKLGSVSPDRNIPKQDVTLLATTANLVIQEELHPALAYLLLGAAQQTHNRPSLLGRPGDFPGTQGTDFPLARETDRFLKNGRPLLQRYLPFWMANFVQRLILFVVPMVAMLLPLFTLMPKVLGWKHQNRLFKRYGEIKFIESEILSKPLSASEISETFLRLDQIEREIVSTKFSLAFSDRVYTLRQHVDFVRQKLAGLAAHPAPDAFVTPSPPVATPSPVGPRTST